MDALEQLFPPFGIRITTGDLDLRVLRDVDLPECAALVVAGVHDPAVMPFGVPWTDAPAEELPTNAVRYQWGVRSACHAQDWSLVFAVRRRGELVGIQEIGARDFAVLKVAGTGSWLARRFHRQGIGTAMRTAVCAFAFDHLGAEAITSVAFADNPASLGVSRKVGYRDNGVGWVVRRGRAAKEQRLLLRPEWFIRTGTPPLSVDGVAGFRRFISLDNPA